MLTVLTVNVTFYSNGQPPHCTILHGHFTAQGLTKFPVSSYAAIESKMEEGTANRTVAATQMNATSSRAHTIVAITFIQKYKNAAGAETAKKSVVNLVDLAGR